MRIAVIGLAGVGSVHVAKVSDMENAELVCVCDIVPDIAQRVGEEYKTAAYTSAEEMLEKEDLNAKEFWKFFYRLSLELKDFLRDDFEKNAYASEDPEFSHVAFIWLLNHLKERKTVLLNPKNALLRGTINEMERIFKVHGGYESEIMQFHC